MFRRDATTGRLTFSELHKDGIDGVQGLGGATAAVASPDSNHVYVTGKTDNAVAVFENLCRDLCAGPEPVICAALDECHDAGVCDPSTGLCSNPEAADGTACDDGDLCTQTDICIAGSCVGMDPVVCPALDQCHDAGACDPVTGSCSNPDAQDGTLCDDGDGCTQTDICTAGSCTGTPVTCTAIDQCHDTGTCDPATGFCSNPDAAEGTPCDDGSLCTQSDRCHWGSCVGSDPVICTPLDQCHDVGLCNPATGVCSDPLTPDGTPCDDGDGCTQTDTCGAGLCVGTDPVICTAIDQCHEAGVCDPGTGVCSNPLSSDGLPCDDGAFCTVDDSCEAGVCQGGERDCSETGDQCNSAACDDTADACVARPLQDGTPCDDGNGCTQTDTCGAGLCVGADHVVCAALDQCHEAGTCDPATGLCSNPPTADGTSCNDDNVCTQKDSCTGGGCTGSDPVTCAALDQCHDAGSCDPATGLCSNPLSADGTPCDDGNPCTRIDTCAAGACAGADPVVCSARDDCHEAGVCDPATGVCSNPEAADGTPCNDDDLCTRSDSCVAGNCAGADPVVCTALDQCHDTGICDSSTGLCSHPFSINGAPCNDGNPCTGTDTCTAGVCVGADPVVCTASDECHEVGVCDPTTGECSNPPLADGTPCNDDNVCTQSSSCTGGSCVGTDAVVCTAIDQCHDAGVCDPATGECSTPAKPDGTPCDDSDLCTQRDACVAGVCTGTDAVVCTAIDQCHNAGTCDPTTGECSSPLRPNGFPCDDGDGCTQTDRCVAGSCGGIDAVICTALDECHDTGVCDPATGECSAPAKVDGTPCDDGDACTKTDTCTAGVCVGANPVICTAIDACHNAGVCDPATGLCSNSSKPDVMQVSFEAEADTYTDEEESTINFGTSTTLRVDGRPKRRAYLRFNVTGIDGLTVNTAVVRLQTTNDPTAGSEHAGNIAAVSDTTWDELTLTHDNRPLIDSTNLASVGPVEPSQTVDFDVTPAILGDGIYSFGIKPGSNDMAIFHSREALVGQPELIVFIDRPCDDANACTQTDRCVAGSCVGSDPILCTPLDECHDAGTCDPATGECSTPPSVEGTPCDDGDLCTRSDACIGGSCVGQEPVICTAVEECHDPGVCDPSTGLCSDPVPSEDGAPCNDGNACTRNDTCIGGSCVGGDPLTCADLDPCHDAGVCDPAAGQCSNPGKADGSPCDDGNACTRIDGCLAGVCVGTDPVTCPAADQCHDAGVCDPATGQCSNPGKADGAPCDDGNACTRTDGCVAGICAGTDPVTCPAADQCRDAGTCDPATGACSGATRANGSPCDDGNACTRTDSCVAGICVGADLVTCPAADQCHDGGTCNPATGTCSGTTKADGSPCDDGNGCTEHDSCVAGRCVSGNPVTCTAPDQCREAGTCNPATGTCSGATKADGTPCDDGNACTDDDLCFEGECIGEPLPDADGDGFCDATDVCPQTPDSTQLDTDGDGVGDRCQCTGAAPGSCIAGGGSQLTDCMLEINPAGPLTLNGRGTKVKPVLHCSDGDPACDLDDARDGQCTFGVSLCFGNTDPRYPRCIASTIYSVEVLQPSVGGSKSLDSQINANTLEQALGSLGLEVRRRGWAVTGSITSMGNNQCSPLIRLVTPAPKTRAGKAVRRKFQLRARDAQRHLDTDSFVLLCQ